MSAINTIIKYMQENNISILKLTEEILKSTNPEYKKLHQSLASEATSICVNFYQDSLAHDAVKSWAMLAVIRTMEKELEELSHQSHGLHFRATTATSEQLEGSFVQEIAGKICAVAPNLWMLVRAALQVPVNNGSNMNVDLPEFGEIERDLGKIGGDDMCDVDLEGHVNEAERMEDLDSRPVRDAVNPKEKILALANIYYAAECKHAV
ncbi:hypothetical protein SERLA73DRAFT_148970 [Serpula lacrymans var. lacrymans S7.3]|uniref:Uncharacterized protein n=2 Tax=Serpula lacrymans var. lacrymans TaxID=341189 RepID=F8PH92_SERL3|nr:uncharacterized protein SERLADRAFT_404566 [Serpula lacrymans var. lacrymans S7.9]EGO04476.1 hypothetical protein SERLA73DRAFT_148970 [Serpula lacrymans var. lacrymans S7.3]EGO30360.1 hypothetical protein SERLADRAFT_404566 [Serpula lacrymans var. lacrymans S7.9]